MNRRLTDALPNLLKLIGALGFISEVAEALLPTSSPYHHDPNTTVIVICGGLMGLQNQWFPRNRPPSSDTDGPAKAA